MATRATRAKHTRAARDNQHGDSEPTSSYDASHLSSPAQQHTPTHPSDLSSSDNDDDDGSRSRSPSPSIRHPQRTNTLSKSYTPAEETNLVRKLDRNLTLFLSLLYLLSFLDRSNIGNARIAGLSTSLSLTSSQYASLLTAFYLTYILFEPLILCYRFLPARYYIPACVVSWGVVASCQSLATAYPQLLVLRGFLGVSEAAFGPGVPFYMTFFYKRRELAYRVGLQISAAPLATSCASALAWFIVWVNQKIGGEGGVESWRVLFLVEGFPSVLVGVWALWWVPDGPGSARWLSVRERRVGVLRLREDGDAQHHHQQQQTAGSGAKSTDRATVQDRLRAFAAELRTTLSDPKCYLTALMFFSVNVSFASLPVFLPTIINDMNFSPLASQALAAPPYLCAFAFVLLVGHYSDKLPDSRSIFLVLAAGMSSAAYFVIALCGAILPTSGTLSIVLRYISVYPAAMGLFASVVLIITWTLNNQQSATGKGLAMTVLNLLGQCGPLVGVRLFPDGDAPGFVVGMAVCGGFMAGVVVLAGGLRWYLGRLNRRVLMGSGLQEVELEMRERLMGDEEGVGGDEGEGGGGEERNLKGGQTGDGGGQRFRFML